MFKVENWDVNDKALEIDKSLFGNGMSLKALLKKQKKQKKLKNAVESSAKKDTEEVKLSSSGEELLKKKKKKTKQDKHATEDVSNKLSQRMPKVEEKKDSHSIKPRSTNDVDSESAVIEAPVTVKKKTKKRKAVFEDNESVSKKQKALIAVSETTGDLVHSKLKAAKHDVVSDSNKNIVNKDDNLKKVKKVKKKKKKVQIHAVEEESLVEIKNKTKSISKNSGASQFNIEGLKSLLNKESLTSKKPDKESVDVTVGQKKKKTSADNGSDSFKAKMMDKLHGARFRYLNEQMYSQSSSKTRKLFAEDPDVFQVYHEGFQAQVARWPVNPVDRMIDFITARSSALIVADFGCGEARIANEVPNTVHSFDLVAVNDMVTVCDIAKVPLDNASVDIGVFCLSLMGTNFVDFLFEANRVLKKGGILLIAEVVSRFENLEAFVDGLSELGFTCTKQETTKMFVWLECVKVKTCSKDKTVNLTLLPCLYKKR